MGKLSICRFCNIIDGQYQFNEIDEPFASNDKFIAVASIGSLVEGWSLVIPKEHQLSMKNFYGQSELSALLKGVIPQMICRYGPLIAFEHGSNQEGSITACGTDHAHLHLVPFDDSLLPQMQEANLEWAKCSASEISFRVKNNEYLFYCELGTEQEWADPEGYLHILEKPISQFFRHMLAARLGCVEISDYRRFPQLEMARQTRNSLMGSII